MAKIKVIFFDFGNTLVNSCVVEEKEKTETVMEMIKIYGLEKNPGAYRQNTRKASEAARRFYDEKFAGVPLTEFDSQAAGIFYAKAFCENLILSIGEKIEKKLLDRLYAAYLRGNSIAESLFPDTRQTLSLLKKHFRLGIISNNSSEFVRNPMAHLKLDNFFEIVIVSGEEGTGIIKPLPEIFLRALAAAGVKPSEALMTGDSLIDDIEGGRKAGMKTAWLSDRKNKTDALRFKPDYIISGISEILDIPELEK